MFLRLSAIVLGAVLALSTLGCSHLRTVGNLKEQLETVPDGYVSGEVASLDRRALLDNKDFIYTIAIDPRGTRAAYTHLAGKTFNLALWDFAQTPPKQLGDVVTNEYQYDVESMDYSPDGSVLVTAGRDGAVRFFNPVDGKLITAFYAEEPLVSVTFMPDGKHVVAGSARGLLVVLNWPNPTYASELRAHRDEVRALAVTPGGHLVSGGWDKTIAEFELVDGPIAVDEIHLAIGTTLERTPVVRAGLEGHAGLFAYDAALPYVVVSSALAKQAGIQESLLTESVMVNGKGARLARGRTINLKQVALTGVDVAVCSTCLPPGADGILGSAVFGRFEVTSNPSLNELILIAREKHDPATLPKTAVLKRVRQHVFESYVNDFSIDRAGKRLGVAFSAEKAERNRVIYDREKKGIPAPFHAGDFGAIVDLATGKLEYLYRPHLGVVSTAGISPDGKAIATGGWDKKVYLFRDGDARPLAEEKFGWSVRRVRFSRDGRFLAIAAWTPQNAVGNQQSDPSAVIHEVGYRTATIVPPPATETAASSAPAPQPATVAPAP